MTSIEHKLEHKESHGNSDGHDEHGSTSTSNWQTNPLPTSYGYLWDGLQWYRTTRKYGDIGRETNGTPYSHGVEDKEFRDNQSVRKGKYCNAH